MGVAVITSISGFSPFAESNALCLTPNLCCSSVITSPSLSKLTLSWMIAWVPTTTSIFPSFIPSSTFCFSFPVIPPFSSAITIPVFLSRFVKVSICCSASISVGTIIVPWYPLLTHLNSARAAMTVLPEPTSPCTSLFIMPEPSMSLLTSSKTLSCAEVSLKGKCSINSFISLVFLNLIPFCPALFSFFICINPDCSIKNSSNISLFLASFSLSIDSGKWILLMQKLISASPYFLRSSSGNKSACFSAYFNAAYTAFLISFCDRPSVRE